jgi:3-hydroxyacyl-[acyl-carrier-protein] dehydratase
MKLSKPEIAGLLDIEPPFLMLDEVLEIVPGRSVHAIKVIDAQEWFMHCHLRRSPVMPGTLQTEAMLQAFVLQIYTVDASGNHTFVRSFDTTLFRKIDAIDAGSVLHARANISDSRLGVVKGSATLTLNDELVASANIIMVTPSAMAVPRSYLR